MGLAHENVSLDGAQQLLWTQEWRLGYGLQPPLYTWLLRSLFLAFGVSLPVMAAFKEGLLLLAAVLVYRAGRRLSGDATTAALGALGLLLLPQFSYESHRDLSHTVLATALAAATLDVATRLRERPRGLLYPLLGLAAGLALLSKWNAAIFLASLLAAALSLPSWRPVFADRRMLIAVAVAAAVVLPHAWWAARGGFDAAVQREAVERLGLADGSPWLGGRLRDLGHVALTAVAFAAPLAAAAAWSRRAGAPIPEPPGAADGRRFLERLAAAQVGLVLGGTLLLGVGNHRARWLLPLFFFLPLLAAMRLRPGPSGARRFAIASALALLLAAVAVFGWVLVLPLAGRWTRYNVPYAALAREIGRGDVRNVLAEDYWGAGCLRLSYPHAAVFGANRPRYARPRPGPTLVVWRGEAIPPELLAALPGYGIEAPRAGAARLTRLPYRLAPRGEQAFGWFVAERR